MNKSRIVQKLHPKDIPAVDIVARMNSLTLKIFPEGFEIVDDEVITLKPRSGSNEMQDKDTLDPHFIDGYRDTETPKVNSEGQIRRKSLLEIDNEVLVEDIHTH